MAFEPLANLNLSNVDFSVPTLGPIASALASAGNGSQVLPDIRAAGLWTLTSSRRIALGLPPVQMAINANQVKHARAKRFTKADTLEGSTFMHYLDKNGRNNDLLKLDFRGNTGNIDLRGSAVSEAEIEAATGILGPRGTAADAATARTIDTGAFFKLLTFHQLRQLSLEALVFVPGIDNASTTPVPTAVAAENEFMIQYLSPIYPSNILITGIFDQAVSFTEDAEDPNSVDYEFGFWVQSVYPDEDEFISLLETSSAQSLLSAAQQV